MLPSLLIRLLSDVYRLTSSCYCHELDPVSLTCRRRQLPGVVWHCRSLSAGCLRWCAPHLGPGEEGLRLLDAGVPPRRRAAGRRPERQEPQQLLHNCYAGASLLAARASSLILRLYVQRATSCARLVVSMCADGAQHMYESPQQPDHASVTCRPPSRTRRAPASATAALMTPGCSSTTALCWTWEASGSSPALRGWTTWASRTARRI